MLILLKNCYTKQWFWSNTCRLWPRRLFLWFLPWLSKSRRFFWWNWSNWSEKVFQKITFPETLKDNGFFFARIMQFPYDDFIIPNIVTKTFFKSFHNAMIVKIHLHHFHVIGKIHDYAHEFSNCNVSGKLHFFTCIAHNFFEFYFFSGQVYTKERLENKKFFYWWKPTYKCQLSKFRGASQVCRYTQILSANSCGPCWNCSAWRKICNN